MEGILVFDMSNDLLYKNLNDGLQKKLISIAKERGLCEDELTREAFIQIFSPLLANLRFMLIQFDNSFDYVKGEHGFNMVFGEYLGFIFITISDSNSMEFMHRSQGAFISFTRFVLGPAIYNLKCDSAKADMVTRLYNKWSKLFAKNQSVCLEVLEQLTVNNDVKNSIVLSLEHALEKLKHDPKYQKSHAMILVENKFVSMFSMRTSQQLSPADIFFVNLFCQIYPHSIDDVVESRVFFLHGMTNACIPHRFHRIAINPSITLIILAEFGNTIVSTNLYSTLVQLSKIKILQAQCEMEGLVIETEKLDKYVKSVSEVAKKMKHTSDEEEVVRSFINKYDNLKRKYVEMLKIMDKNQLVKVESYFPYFVESAKDLFQVCNEFRYIFNSSQTKLNEFPFQFQILFLNDVSQSPSTEQSKLLLAASSLVKDRISKYFDLLNAKLDNAAVMASYLEEFAGLIHFIFIDRQRGTCISPNIDITASQTSDKIKLKVWEMIETARTFLQNGKTCCIWKDFGFSFCYNLWYEDSNGQPLKPKVQVNLSSANSTVKSAKKVPGMLATDFYQ